MKAAKLLILGLALTGLVIYLQHAAFADEFSITGNAAGSLNQIDINQQQSTSIKQSNQSSFINDVDANANTGGNRVSGDGDSIKTGDSRVNINIDNQGNVNRAEVPCCPTPPAGGPTPTPDPGKPKPTATPTPTTRGTQPPSPTGGGGNGGGGNGGGGGVGGGQVLGLAAASGENYVEKTIVAAGIVCLLAGAYLVRQNHAHV